MDVKQAVKLAKDHINDLFVAEGISNLGLEEVEFDDNSKTWNVTIGFHRSWDMPVNPLAAFAQQINKPVRYYKVVCIDDSTGSVRSVKIRETHSGTESA